MDACVIPGAPACGERARILYKCVSGSRAYRTANADSGIGSSGIYEPPPVGFTALIPPPALIVDERYDREGEDPALPASGIRKRFGQDELAAVFEVRGRHARQLIVKTLRDMKSELTSAYVRNAFGGMSAARLSSSEQEL